eukprot:COSAG01_NODE_70162_length_259_cov_0.837500_1_plen_39_part_10
MACDGYTYERRAIAEWLEQHRTSPITHEHIDDHTLIPNR